MDETSDIIFRTSFTSIVLVLLFFFREVNYVLSGSYFPSGLQVLRQTHCPPFEV